jgi:cytochrome oxidase assembly protein ShyY1
VIWSLLRTRRWLGFTAVVIGAVVAFGLLSQWQWSRAEEKRLQRLELQGALAMTPAPLSGVALAAGRTVGTHDQWRAVATQGTYLPDAQVVVRKRPLDTRNGFWVMTAMHQTDDTVVWVNRGWLPAGRDALSTPQLPAPPSGQVEISGYLRAFEESDADGNTGLPTGQIAAPAAALLPPVAVDLQGYVQLATSDPAQDGLIVLPVPTVDEGQNISYAIQWLLFAGVAIGGWFFFLRREAIEDAERQSDPSRVAVESKGA